MLQPNTLDPATISQNNWQQGASLLIEANNPIYIRTQENNAQVQLKEGLYIVLSQDCDIVNYSLEKEPVIEIIEANQISLCNPEMSSGKNPRILHLDIGGSALEFIPHKRYFISRHYLELVTASDVTIKNPQLRILKRWIVKRTIRSAFPDSFNHRINSKTVKQMKKILGNESKESLGLFIRLASEKELPKDQPYKMLLKMMVSKEVYDNEESLHSIEDGFNQILDLLDNINGIQVIEGSQAQSMDDISAHNFLELKQWDFDYISFSNNEDGEVLDEELM